MGVACYAVLSHKVTAGETAYSICNTNGVSYNGNLKLLQVLNNKENLSYITSGSTFMLRGYCYFRHRLRHRHRYRLRQHNYCYRYARADHQYHTQQCIYTQAGWQRRYALAFYVNNKAVTSATTGSTVTVVSLTTQRQGHEEPGR